MSTVNLILIIHTTLLIYHLQPKTEIQGALMTHLFMLKTCLLLTELIY